MRVAQYNQGVNQDSGKILFFVLFFFNFQKAKLNLICKQQNILVSVWIPIAFLLEEFFFLNSEESYFRKERIFL